MGSLLTYFCSMHPFGEGVAYAIPARPLDLSIRPTSPPQLRYMQSFESGLTARADDPERHHPKIPLPRPSTTLSQAHSSASPYPTEVFEVLQTYRGIPLANTLSALSTETTFKISASVSAVPKDDPRFVIWGELATDQDDGYSTSQSDVSGSVSSRANMAGSMRRGSTVTDGHPPGIPLGQKVIVAATIERWIAQLTSELNYVELLDFFLTYRVYIRPIDLCQLLICRFHWALEKSQSSQDDTVRKIVRVRTFIAFRYWLTTFFQVDFLPNRELCVLLTSWLNSLSADEDLVENKANSDVLVSYFLICELASY